MFNWLKTIFRSWESPSTPLDSPGISNIISNNPAMSGVEVNRHSVFGLPPFVRGVDLIASTLGRVACNVYKFQDDGKIIDEDHAAQYLLNRRPSEWTTPFEYKRELVSCALWHGNGYAVVIRDDLGKPTDLILLDPDHTWPIIYKSSTDLSMMKVVYFTEIQGQQIPIPHSDMIHLKGISNNGPYLGMSLINVAKEVLGLGIATIRYSSVYFRHNCNPSMVIEFPQWLKDKQQIEQFREGLGAHHAGLSNAHKVMILQNGAKLPTGGKTVSAKDAQLLDSRQMSSLDVALLLGLPPHKLDRVAGMPYGSVQEENLALLSDCYGKWFCNFEQQHERACLTTNENKRGSRIIRFDRSKLYEMDHEQNVGNIITLVTNGLMTRNYAAQELNLPDLGEEGDKLLLPTSVVVVGDEPEGNSPDDLDNPEGNSPEPTMDDPEPDDGKNADASRLRALTEATLTRFKTRLHKAASAAARTKDWTAWCGAGIDEHESILADTLAPLGKSELAGQLLNTVRQELQAVTRDQVDLVFDRLQVQGWVEECLK